MGKKKTALLVGILGFLAVTVSFVLLHRGERPKYPAIVSVKDYDSPFGLEGKDVAEVDIQDREDKTLTTKVQKDKVTEHEKTVGFRHIKSKDRPSATELIERAKKLDQEGRHEEALDELKKAVNIYPDFEGRNEVIRLIREYEEYKAKAAKGQD